jgi:phosphoglucomutase/phosphomannomutase
VQASTDWEQISKLLETEFTALSPNGQLVDKALSLLRQWLFDASFEAQASAVRAHINSGKYALLLDSFYQLVPFGTGGRRGRVGYGPNRINQATVALSVQGHCNYLRQTFPNDALTVVVAYDTRVFRDISKTYEFLGDDHPVLGLTSRALARQACEIYAGNGISAFVPDLTVETSCLSTPELSFAIRHLKAAGGINVSASHNHPDDNGFKFYNREGAQDIPPVDQFLTSFMDNVEVVNRLTFAEGLDRGVIQVLPPEVHHAYLATNLKLTSKHAPASAAPIIYTPLSGTGDSTVGDVLRAAGYAVQLFKPQSNFDGTFSSVPFRLPNPEVPEAARPALAEADKQGAWLVLSTDPDADRVGVYAKAGDGDWRYLTGNDIASILAYYLVLDAELGPRKTGLLIKTLVTTRTLEAIAKRAGCPIVADLLVGFKYIAHVLASLERDGVYEGVRARPEDLVLAAEESHGVLLTPHIRDKDAAGGALILSELTAELRRRGRTLPEYLDALSIECGNFANVSRSIVLRGISGVRDIAAMMESLRSRPVERFGPYAVRRTDDYLSTEQHGPLQSETDRLSRNLLRYTLDGAQIVIRPSGTEPKTKLYVDIEGQKLVAENDRRAAVSLAHELALIVFDVCTERIGIRLSESARLLPDHVDVYLKRDFDQSFRGDLIGGCISLSRLSDDELLGWFRSRLFAYGAGADPLEATAAAVGHLCQTLAAEATDEEARTALLDVGRRVAGAR